MNSSMNIWYIDEIKSLSCYGQLHLVPPLDMASYLKNRKAF